MAGRAQGRAIPVRVLLATDMSARCDRALDRSVQLIQAWNSTLLVITVLDAPSEPDRILLWAAGKGADLALAVARRQIAADLAYLNAEAEVRVMRGSDVAKVIGESAAADAAELVVIAVARDEPLGRFLLGSSVERLARSLDRPLLIVRSRPHGAYRRVVVASELDEESRTALLTARRWFPESEVDFFHARRGPAGIQSGNPGGALRDAGPQGRAACERFLDECGLAASELKRIVAVEGVLEASLTRYVRDSEADLVVIGSRERSAMLGLLTGGSLNRLLQWLPCDVLVVPPHAGTG